MKRRVTTLGLCALITASVLLTWMPAGSAESFYSWPAELRSKRATTTRVILDGIEYPISQLPVSNTGRTYVLTKAGQEKGVVHAFSSNDEATTFMRSVMANRRESAAASCEHTASYSYFNKCAFASCLGSNLFMDRDTSTTFPPKYFTLDSIGWNNSISYVAAACIDRWTVIYSCRQFQLFQGPNCDDPDKYSIEPGVIIEDLNTIGFNNRTSSIRFCTSDLEPCVE